MTLSSCVWRTSSRSLHSYWLRGGSPLYRPLAVSIRLPCSMCHMVERAHVNFRRRARSSGVVLVFSQELGRWTRWLSWLNKLNKLLGHSLFQSGSREKSRLITLNDWMERLWAVSFKHGVLIAVQICEMWIRFWMIGRTVVVNLKPVNDFKKGYFLQMMHGVFGWAEQLLNYYY